MIHSLKIAEADARIFREQAARIASPVLRQRYMAHADRREAVAAALRAQLALSHEPAQIPPLVATPPHQPANPSGDEGTGCTARAVAL